MSVNNGVNQDTAFQYLIQDFSKYYIGARMTYNTMIDNDDMPSRFRSAIFRYMEDEVSLDTTIAPTILANG